MWSPDKVETELQQSFVGVSNISIHFAPAADDLGELREFCLPVPLCHPSFADTETQVIILSS